ncbi:MAG: GNAT family N-acetyltransferase [Patescibacteria group bacterium]|nr:GNAT family N-acetyltransferase [Patescibacteria group bacterium]
MRKKVVGFFLFILISNTSWPELQDSKKEINHYLSQANKKKLWDILHETSLEKLISEQKLKNYADNIKQLCTETPDILNEKFENDPLEYSLAHCHEEIDAALIGAKKVTGESTHISRSPKQKKLAEDYALKTSKTLVMHIKKLVPNEFFTNPNFVGADTIKLEVNNDNLNWQFSYKAAKERVFLITAIEKISLEKIGYIECSLKVEDGEKLLNINDLSVSKTKRLGGLGKTMLLTVIDLVKSLYQNSRITLYSLADDDAMRITLIKYYKSFGFIPDKADPANMTMYIKDGNIRRAHELTVQ